MFYISDVHSTAPAVYKTQLQKGVYQILEQLGIHFERVDTDEAITMEDCIFINKTLGMKMVKTIFLCNRKQSDFYLFITCGDKPFSSKGFSKALGVARVSFTPPETMEKMLGTKVGAATVFSAAVDTDQSVRIIFDREVVERQWYGCSDGTTTGYLKVSTDDIINRFLPFTKHELTIIEV